MNDDERDLDAVAGQVLAGLLERSHLLPPGDVANAIAEQARPLGVCEVCVYLVDLQQRQLHPMPGASGRAALPIDTSLAGRAYRTVQIMHTPEGGEGERHRVWVPVIDGTERLGVLELAVRDVSGPMLDHYRALASLAGLVIVSKGNYSDTYAQVRRTRDMVLQAEMVWAFLAPRTFATDRVVVAATLEPAYDVGGDAFDYSLSGDRLHVSIFDAVGHDLAAGLIASVGMASCRSTRRAGGSLPEIAARADHAIARQFGKDRFVTALLCDLDLSTGELSWIPCGHPPPLLLRGNKVVKELLRPPQLPLGISGLDRLAFGDPYSGEPYDDDTIPVYTERLEPRDRVLLYTDGITEGRAADATPFGTERLGDFIIRHSDAGMPAPEMLRRLNRAIIEYQHGRLADDATIVMMEWLPDQPARKLTP